MCKCLSHLIIVIFSLLVEVVVWLVNRNFNERYIFLNVFNTIVLSLVSRMLGIAF